MSELNVDGGLGQWHWGSHVGMGEFNYVGGCRRVSYSLGDVNLYLIVNSLCYG